MYQVVGNVKLNWEERRIDQFIYSKTLLTRFYFNVTYGQEFGCF